jgi:nucleoside-diphosphate-sugar epimerase
VKALITGIAGFTGRYLARALKAHNIAVVGISQSDQILSDVEHVHNASVTDLDAVRTIISHEQPDYVVHLAAISFIVHQDVEEIYRTNILGTKNILTAIAEQKKLPNAVLIASSSNVYGNRHPNILNEDLPPDPVNDYAISKVATEHVAAMFRNHLPIVIARPFNYTGVGQAPEFLIPKIINRVRSGARSIALGNLNVARDFSDVRFVAEAYYTLLNCPRAIGQTVNVCSGKAYELSQILGMIAEIVGYKLEVEVDPALVRPNEVSKLWGDPSRLNTLIGMIDRIDFKDTLRWMIETDI